VPFPRAIDHHLLPGIPFPSSLCRLTQLHSHERWPQVSVSYHWGCAVLYQYIVILQKTMDLYPHVLTKRLYLNRIFPSQSQSEETTRYAEYGIAEISDSLVFGLAFRLRDIDVL
jgi:hypothetical protein